MPYIKSDNDRRMILRGGGIAQNAGELNYQMFYMVKHYVRETTEPIIRNCVCNFVGEKPNYQKYNDLTGAIVRCYREIKRRLNIDADFLLTILDNYDNEIAVYEDIKVRENGDVE
jgi:hypothetical protein